MVINMADAKSNNLKYIAKSEIKFLRYYIVNKQQLLSPAFKNELASSKKRPIITCADSELYFNEHEYQILLDIYKRIKTIDHEARLMFEEKIYSGTTEVLSSDGKRDYEFDITHINGITFEEVVEANRSLLKFAEKVNKGYKNKDGDIVELSPYEKYLICFEFINRFPYFIENDDKKVWESQSFIKTAQNLSGCCAGKSQCLKALLNMVGIDSCCISVDTRIEDYRRDYHKLLVTYNDESLREQFEKENPSAG